MKWSDCFFFSCLFCFFPHTPFQMETDTLPTDPAPQDESHAVVTTALWTPEAAEAALNAAVDEERVVTAGKMDDDTDIIADPDRTPALLAAPDVHSTGSGEGNDDEEEDLRCRSYDDEEEEEEEDIAQHKHQDGVVEGISDEADLHPSAAPADGTSAEEDDSEDAETASVPARAAGVAQWVGRAVGFLEGSPVVRGVLRAAWLPLVIGLGVATVRPGITLLDALAPINFRDRSSV